MEFHSKLATSKFHGIPCNCSCQRHWCTPSSMEFHATARVSDIGAPQVPWNSMKLLVSAKLAHSKFSKICAKQVPWNSVIFFLFNGTVVSSICWVLNLDRIPWNLSFQILTYWYFIINIFALYHMHFRHYSLRIKISFKISFQCPLKLNLTKKFHETSSRVP